MQLQELVKNSNHLEHEKENLLLTMNMFFEGIDLDEEYLEGRPRASQKDILKSLLIMNYHSWSYRRANSDIESLYKDGLISHIPKRATLNKYMLDSETTKTLCNLISLSALAFIDVEDEVIIDSTWFSQYARICSAHKRKVSDRILRLPSLEKTRKVHIVCFKESKVVISAVPTHGTVNDNLYFLYLMNDCIKRGFTIKKILADKAYGAKDNFLWCQENGITKAFIDFKKNAKYRNSGSSLRKDMLNMKLNRPEEWKESYRFRPIIEGLFSTVKRKGKFHYLKSKKPNSQDCEILLKVFWHNLTTIAKYST